MTEYWQNTKGLVKGQYNRTAVSSVITECQEFFADDLWQQDLPMVGTEGSADLTQCWNTGVQRILGSKTSCPKKNLIMTGMGLLATSEDKR